MNAVTRPAIEQALRPLLRQPLLAIGRAVDMTIMSFGHLRQSDGLRGPVEVAEFSLHVQCPWRIVRDGLVLVGYQDWRYPPIGSDGDGGDFDPSEALRNRRDDLEDVVLAHGNESHVVTELVGAPTGDLHVGFADGCRLEVFAHSAQRDDAEEEYWRFLLAGEDIHFVATSHGIEG